MVLAVTDQRGGEAGSVVTAEMARLLQVEVEIERPPGPVWVSAGRVQEVPGLDAQGKLGSLIEKCEDFLLVHRASDFPSLLVFREGHHRLDVADELFEVLVGHKVAVNRAEQTNPS